MSVYGLTDYHHVGESIPRPRTLLDTNDSLRARALHFIVAELDLTVTNTWMDADSEQELLTRSSLVRPCGSVDTNGLHHVFKETTNETCASAGLRLVQVKTDHRAVFADLTPKMRYTMKSDAHLRAVGKGKVTQKIGNQRDVSDRARAQIASAEEEKKTSTQDQGKCRDGEKAPRKHKSKHFNWSNKKNQKKFSILLPRPLRRTKKVSRDSVG